MFVPDSFGRLWYGNHKNHKGCLLAFSLSLPDILRPRVDLRVLVNKSMGIEEKNTSQRHLQ